MLYLYWIKKDCWQSQTRLISTFFAFKSLYFQNSWHYVLSNAASLCFLQSAIEKMGCFRKRLDLTQFAWLGGGQTCFLFFFIVRGFEQKLISAVQNTDLSAHSCFSSVKQHFVVSQILLISGSSWIDAYENAIRTKISLWLPKLK